MSVKENNGHATQKHPFYLHPDQQSRIHSIPTKPNNLSNLSITVKHDINALDEATKEVFYNETNARIEMERIEKIEKELGLHF